MTTDEAIKILEQDRQHPTANFMPELKEAERLGIEALKQHRERRRRFPLFPHWLLPGETEE